MPLNPATLSVIFLALAAIAALAWEIVHRDRPTDPKSTDPERNGLFHRDNALEALRRLHEGSQQ